MQPQHHTATDIKPNQPSIQNPNHPPAPTQHEASYSLCLISPYTSIPQPIILFSLYYFTLKTFPNFLFSSILSSIFPKKNQRTFLSSFSSLCTHFPKNRKWQSTEPLYSSVYYFIAMLLPWDLPTKMCHTKSCFYFVFHTDINDKYLHDQFIIFSCHSHGCTQAILNPF